MLDVGSISSIINGAVSVTGSFLQFGAAVHTANQMEAPDGGSFNVTINTQPRDKSGDNVQLAMLVGIVLVMLIIAAIVLFKFL